MSKLLDRTVEFGDWGFGIIHEIGHAFSQGNIKGSGRWNWNDEIFANFRMSYALEACDGIMSQRDICYRGADVINYYKIFYDETIGAGIPENMRAMRSTIHSCASRSVTAGMSIKRRSGNCMRWAIRGRRD